MAIKTLVLALGGLVSMVVAGASSRRDVAEASSRRDVAKCVETMKGDKVTASDLLSFCDKEGPMARMVLKYACPKHARQAACQNKDVEEKMSDAMVQCDSALLNAKGPDPPKPNIPNDYASMCGANSTKTIDLSNDVVRMCHYKRLMHDTCYTQVHVRDIGYEALTGHLNKSQRCRNAIAFAASKAWVDWHDFTKGRLHVERNICTDSPSSLQKMPQSVRTQFNEDCPEDFLAKACEDIHSAIKSAPQGRSSASAVFCGSIIHGASKKTGFSMRDICNSEGLSVGRLPEDSEKEISVSCPRDGALWKETCQRLLAGRLQTF